MTHQIKVLGISGSLRNKSYNTMLLKHASKFLPDDFSFTLAEISNLPYYNDDLENNLPKSVTEFVELCRTADAVLITTPEYNGQIPGVLKNALDWVSIAPLQKPLALKPIAIMGASTGLVGTARAQTNLRNLLFALNMDPVNRPEVRLSQANLKFNEDGILTDDKDLQMLEQLITNLVVKVRKNLEENN
jgi:chromate reductase